MRRRRHDFSVRRASFSSSSSRILQFQQLQLEVSVGDGGRISKATT
jgi:hypothetical protein